MHGIGNAFGIMRPCGPDDRIILALVTVRQAVGGDVDAAVWSHRQTCCLDSPSLSGTIDLLAGWLCCSVWMRVCVCVSDWQLWADCCHHCGLSHSQVSLKIAHSGIHWMCHTWDTFNKQNVSER